MIENEITVKGIILAVYSQGEYGKRISLLSDHYGKITVFAQGAAKQKSKIIGAVRPFVCGTFTLAQGKGAWNLHGVEVMESFEEIPRCPEAVFLGTYFLEFASYFSEEGIAPEDARNKLNLLYVALSALRDSVCGDQANNLLPTELIRRIFELRMFVQEGIYTETPCEADCTDLWMTVLRSPLSSLFDRRRWESAFTGDRKLTETGKNFVYSVVHLKNTQTDHHFKSEELL